MKILIKTTVSKSIQEVWEGFDRTLFDKLQPPGMPVRLKRFDGCMKGDEVHLEMWMFGWRPWRATIVDQGESDDEIFFIDVGGPIPWPLATWRHRHRLCKEGAGTTIIDDIEYTASSKLLGGLMWPVLYLTFLYRKPVYKKVFGK